MENYIFNSSLVSYYPDGDLFYKGYLINGEFYGHWIDDFTDKPKITFFIT